MFSYYPRTPRTSQSSYPIKNFYQPTQYSHPCSYYYHNTNPFYNLPESFYYPTPQNYSNYSGYDDEQRQKVYERPQKSFKVKIQGDDDETKTTVDKFQAAHKISNFIKRKTANKQTRQILNKLHALRMIENELKEIHQTKSFGNLRFDKEHEKQILPISIENKRFLEYENKIMKLFDKLDRVQSGDVDIIRERRKFIVKLAQTLLEELDNEKENQWIAFSNENQIKSDESSTTNESSVVEIDVAVPSIEDSTGSEHIEENSNENVDLTPMETEIEVKSYTLNQEEKDDNITIGSKEEDDEFVVI